MAEELLAFAASLDERPPATKAFTEAERKLLTNSDELFSKLLVDLLPANLCNEKKLSSLLAKVLNDFSDEQMRNALNFDEKRVSELSAADKKLFQIVRARSQEKDLKSLNEEVAGKIAQAHPPHLLASGISIRIVLCALEPTWWTSSLLGKALKQNKASVGFANFTLICLVCLCLSLHAVGRNERVPANRAAVVRLGRGLRCAHSALRLLALSARRRTHSVVCRFMFFSPNLFLWRSA